MDVLKLPMQGDISPSLLKIQNATVLRNGQRVLDQICLDIREGEHTAILGPNGSGKSSLIKLITYYHHALAQADGTPTVSVFGRANWNVFELRSVLGIVSADLHSAFTNGTSSGRLRGLDAVLSGFFASHGLFQHHDVTPTMEAQAWQALNSVQAAHLASKSLEALSTGEARRILIARALVVQPRALILDEPTTGLDLVTRERFLLTLRQLARAHKTIILVTHHVEEIFPEIERVVLLQEGHIVGDGPKQEMLTDARLTAAFGGPVQVHENAGYYVATSSEASRSGG